MYIQLTELRDSGTYEPDGAIEFFDEFVRFHDIEAWEVERYMRGLFALPQDPAVMLSDGAVAFHEAMRFNMSSYQGAKVVKGAAPEGNRHLDVLLKDLPVRHRNSRERAGLTDDELGEYAW